MVVIRDVLFAIVVLFGLFILIEWADHRPQPRPQHPQVERLVPLETI